MKIPKSVCYCGHTGDGPDSQHVNGFGPIISPGHGKCKVVTCSCEKFTWRRYVSLDELVPDFYKREYKMKEGK